MSQNDKPKLAAARAARDIPDMQNARIGKYQRFTAEPQPDPYKAAPRNASYGSDAEYLAELCKVSVATARRWKAGTSRIPALTAAALDMGLVHVIRSWPGWKFTADELISPDGWRISRNDALSVPLMHGQIQALRQRISELEALTDVQPYPGSELDDPSQIA